ncbi:MAG: hypothetical protein ACD_79C00756G0003 [uncultured bacterium]|nr:MAG: hypothetical protein ACD_79C00756G0003 [uncultured bacterium]
MFVLTLSIIDKASYNVVFPRIHISSSRKTFALLLTSFLAGTPTTVSLAGISATTTDPVPTVTLSSITT